MDHSWIMTLIMGMGGFAGIITAARLSIRLFFVERLKRGDRTPASTPRTRGIVIHWARAYDLILRFATGGREQELRQTFVELARLEPGEVVLDVGCGTGTLAMVAKERVGATGRVIGIDPSRQMIARARGKARRASLCIDFEPGVIEQLAFPDQSFDVVLCIWMIHHVPDEIKQQGLSEMARVLKPEGRLLIVDSSVDDLRLKEAGFSQMEAGVIPFRRPLGFTLERKSLATGELAAVPQEVSQVGNLS
ncbi:MAG TPA: methyltransferase domain-containing protein [Ktedonosporobacter sp.]|nr:methyltransferase domain-containing protein [Ktedonosporobacter sp.]